jgi:hypothetical protein
MHFVYIEDQTRMIIRGASSVAPLWHDPGHA